MLRCSECQKPIIEYTKYQNWLALVLYFEHEYTEGEITKETYEAMTDRLMTLKQFVVEND